MIDWLKRLEAEWRWRRDVWRARLRHDEFCSMAPDLEVVEVADGPYEPVVGGTFVTRGYDSRKTEIILARRYKGGWQILINPIGRP
jgi:hypothetical protein